MNLSMSMKKWKMLTECCKAHRLNIIELYNLIPLNMATIEVLPQETTDDPYQTIVIKGEVDRDTIDSLRESMEKVLSTLQKKTLVLNLEHLEFINSEGIGYLTDIYNRLSGMDKKVVIVHASDRIMDIFQLVGLNQIITCYANEEEMKANLSQ
ncbi:anti-sigma factor antagonist [Candidatus Peregrinibacteria bacterium]|nr:anti-sigma factor antagonist [Candidatus Peregrinibacteria bacterium]